MRRISLESVIPGQIVAKSIYTLDCKVLLETGIELTAQNIIGLKNFDIKEIYIEDSMNERIDCIEAISQDTRNQAQSVIRSLMYTNDANLDCQYPIIEYYVNSIIDRLLQREDIVVNLYEIKDADGYTFEHSVSVCIFSLIIGMSIGYSDEDLIELGIGAILHDIGKLKIPGYILKKPGQLTQDEFEIIQQHTYYGYEILCKSSNISKRSAEVALHHHERVDGSGYPNHLLASDIPEFARISAIADVFDALTSDRVYRNKLGLKEVVEYMTSSDMNRFDSEMLESFMKYISLYPIGSIVFLSTGEKAMVMKANRQYPTKPVVKIINDNRVNELSEALEKDLAMERNLYITEICE